MEAEPSLVTPPDSEEPTTKVTEQLEETETEVEATIQAEETEQKAIDADQAVQADTDSEQANAVDPEIAPDSTVEALTQEEKDLEARLKVLEGIVAKEINNPVADQ